MATKHRPPVKVSSYVTVLSLRWQALSQVWGFLTRVCHHGFFHTQVDVLLCPKGGAHKPIQPRHLQEEADTTYPTRTYLNKHDM